MSEPLTFWEHVHDLRGSLLRIFLILITATLLSFTFSSTLVSLLTAPLKEAVQQHPLRSTSFEKKEISNRGSKDFVWLIPKEATILSTSFARKPHSDSLSIPPGGKVIFEERKAALPLIFLTPLSGFTTSMMISFWAGLSLSSPFWIWEVLKFLRPALFRHEKRWILPFVFFSFVAISLGLWISWNFMLPAANRFFFHYNETFGTNLWSFAEYLSFTTSLLLASACISEIAVVLFFLVNVGALSADTLRKFRRFYIVGCFILSALLTPPDVLSQLLAAGPLILFYESAILIAKYKSYRLTGSRSFLS